jgi:hypothetical protein
MNTMNNTDPARFLRQSLRGNALFSTVSGLTFLVANTAIAEFLGGLQSLIVAAVGGQLLIFAGVLVWLASRSEISRQMVIGVIVADILWVVGTIVIVYAELFTRNGGVLATVLAGVVLLLAVLQSIGVHRMSGSTVT